MAWAREGEEQPLSGQQLKAAKAAAGSYSMAVEDSLSAAAPGGTVGDHLRQTWPQVQDCSSAMADTEIRVAAMPSPCCQAFMLVAPSNAGL